MKKINLNALLIVVAAIAVACGIYFIFWWHNEIRVAGGRTSLPEDAELSPLTGLPCQKIERPIAVMMASDPVARPLSGIGQAAMVIEMPVTDQPNQVTRMMAVFQCAEPQEIGSIRSAREPFIPLAQGLTALYAHWGGEHGALEQLNAGVIDNIDALKYDGSTYYRKPEIRKPHNGFTTLALLRDRVKSLGDSLTNTFTGYTHRSAGNQRNISNIIETITIPYDEPYDVRWQYDRATKLYKRFRNNTPETDKITGEQILTANVIVLETTAQPLGDQYLAVKVIGQGEATLYQEGARLNGTWKKEDAASILRFVDSQNRDIALVPGTIWIEYTLTP